MITNGHTLQLYFPGNAGSANVFSLLPSRLDLALVLIKVLLLVRIATRQTDFVIGLKGFAMYGGSYDICLLCLTYY